jgi:hypothetical protein
VRRGADYSKLWDELEQRLSELLGRLDGLLSPRVRHDALHYMEHNEFGLAWHAVAYALIETESRIGGDNYRELLELAELMGIADQEAADELEALRLLVR